MIFLLLAIGVGVATQVPRLRAHYRRRDPGAVWDHFLVQSGLRPVPAAMPDVVTVAGKADVPAEMLDRAALGRADDGALLLVVVLTNDRVLVGARREGPVTAIRGLVVEDGWQLQILPGPATAAWDATSLRGSPTSSAGSTPV